MGNKRRKDSSKKDSKQPKRKRMCYEKENVLADLEEVHEKKSTISEAARKFGVPDSTLRAKNKGVYANKSPGPSSVLSAKEEAELSNWVIECCRRDFPVGRTQLLESVKEICENHKKITPFKNNLPGRYWFEGFMKRNPQIAQRISENVSMNRANISEKSIRAWFAEISSYLGDMKLLDMDPDRIFNSDETGMYFIYHQNKFKYL